MQNGPKAVAATGMTVPCFRPEIAGPETRKSQASLPSGWLGNCPLVRTCEDDFWIAIGARRTRAVNSYTAGLHLAVEALCPELGPRVLPCRLTFVAAGGVRSLRGKPVVVDCDPGLPIAPARRRRNNNGAARDCVRHDIFVTGLASWAGHWYLLFQETLWQRQAHVGAGGKRWE